MQEWPLVTVLVCTYNRPDELLATLKALDHNLSYPPERLRWVIADDCSNYNIQKLLYENMWADIVRVIQTPKNMGWGANVNYAMRQLDSNYIYFTEDDYVLSKTLDLCVGVAVMESVPALGMLRYFGPGGDVGIKYDQKEADISGWLPHYRDTLGLEGKKTYLEFSPDSDSLWILSNRPHLKKAHFHGYYGDYPQGLKLGATEESFAHTVKDGLRADVNAPKVAVFPEFIAPAFDHIGKSFKGSEHDK